MSPQDVTFGPDGVRIPASLAQYLVKREAGGVNAYVASPVKRCRATRDEMEERAEFFIAYAVAHAPMTVRGLYYRAEVAGLPGIDKTELGYAKVQRQVLDAGAYLRRYRGRAARDGEGFPQGALARHQPGSRGLVREGCAAGVISPVTMEFDVKLMVTRGFTSETFAYTFAYEAVEDYQGTGRDLFVIALYDFDGSGYDAARSLREKLERFGAEKGVDV